MDGIAQWQNVIDIATTAVSGVLGWFVKIIWDAIRELKDDMKETNKLIHENYVRKDDYRSDMSDIKVMFNRIMDKLDGKADK
jgi:hypothetical protein